MVERPRLRRLSLADCPDIKELIKDAYDTGSHPYLAYCQHGLDLYLADGANMPLMAEGASRWVALLNGTVHAFAEWQTLSDGQQHLNHIAVAASARRRGLARILITSHLSRAPRDSLVSLDVFAHNHGAQRLYTSLGFEAKGSSSRWLWRPMPPPRDMSNSALVLVDPVGSMASLMRYGFCHLKGRHGVTEFRVGVLGGMTLRAPDSEVYQNDNLLSSLKAHMPQLRRVFVTNADKSVQLPGAPILESVRMTAQVGRVLGKARNSHVR